MRKLRDLSGEPVHLCVLRRGWMVLLDQIETLHKVRIDVEPGSLMYPHASVFGKCLFAYITEAEKTELFSHTLKALTPNTIIKPNDLNQELKKIRQQGYAFDMEEYLEGARCVGAPVHSAQKKGATALGLMGPASRLTQEKMIDAIPMVRETAQKLSDLLGHHPSDSTGLI